MIKIGCIYKITNSVNGKIYVGGTSATIKRRWQEHCHDAKRLKHRPLYIDLNQYGKENFNIEVIEEVSNDRIFEREEFWISYYDSYNKGYNLTFGGAGKPFVDYDLVIKHYCELQEIKSVAETLNISPDSVRNVLNKNGVKKVSSSKIIQDKYGKPVSAYNKDKEFVIEFKSEREAARWLIANKKSIDVEDGIASHIGAVCEGKRKSAYGYYWTH